MRRVENERVYMPRLVIDEGGHGFRASPFAFFPEIRPDCLTRFDLIDIDLNNTIWFFLDSTNLYKYTEQDDERGLRCRGHRQPTS